MAKKQTSATAVEDIRNIMQRNPMKALQLCRDRRTAEDNGFRDDLYEELACVYMIVYLFAKDKMKKQAFINDPSWGECGTKRPSAADDLKEMLLFAARYYFCAEKTKKNPRYNRAYKYARVLYGYAQEKVAGDDVAKRLKADHGIDSVFEASTNQQDADGDVKTPVRTKTGKRAAAKAQKPDDDLEATGDEDEQDGPNESEERVAAEDEDQNQAEDEENSDGDDDAEENNQFKDTALGTATYRLELRTTKDDLLDVLGLKINGEATLRVQRVSDDPKWPNTRYKQRFIVTLVEKH